MALVAECPQLTAFLHGLSLWVCTRSAKALLASDTKLLGFYVALKLCPGFALWGGLSYFCSGLHQPSVSGDTAWPFLAFSLKCP